ATPIARTVICSLSLHDALPILLRVLAMGVLAAGVAALLAQRLSRRIKTALLGYEPDAFARRFLQREDILEALEEGILAIDKEARSEEHTSELQSRFDLVCRLLL